MVQEALLKVDEVETRDSHVTINHSAMKAKPDGIYIYVDRPFFLLIGNKKLPPKHQMMLMCKIGSLLF